MGWKIIEIETDEYIQLYLNNLLIKRIDEKILINLSDIDSLLLHNDRASISLKLLNALSKHNINVILMNSQREPASFVTPVVGNHMSLKIFERQRNWTHEYKGRIWQSIIKNKIKNQSKLLGKIEIDEVKEIDNYFDELIINVKFFDVTNREGHAAKVYWHKLFGIDFIRDQKSIKFPVINSMLNYGYSLIRGLVIRSIYKKGLDPRISFFHKSQGNFFSLASDVMEPFRILIDEIVFKNRNAIIFDYQIKEELLGVFNSKIIINKKRFYINQVIDQAIDAITQETGWKWVDLWD